MGQDLGFNQGPLWWQNGVNAASGFFARYGYPLLGVVVVVALLLPYIQRYVASLRARALASGESTSVEREDRQKAVRRRQQEDALARQAKYLEEEQEKTAKAHEKRLKEIGKKAEFMGFKPQGQAR
eukprot:CAMPEP_0198210952 /NCGR_PEP_ID=MMETSP1445-20131203/22539_1 /TAXON_ID=36898 /ORGANISM="Pyramimonas sp., Strain CCMP2087" /LENGTH=125 /DNA_ID=CAMNT_0043885121 /DNA_START=154 /DNA_END=528 /DNA_ORIENTATION=-